MTGKSIQNQFFQPIFASKGFQAKIIGFACAIFGLFPLPLQPQICIGRFFDFNGRSPMGKPNY
jgi:hypothetical protein